MADVKSYHELLEKTMGSIFESKDLYLDFLRTSGWNYKYSLPDRLLIYAQNPEAIAVASPGVWEQRQVGRMVKQDAKGIALLKDNGVQFVFDVKDTVSASSSVPLFTLWEYEDKLSDVVLPYFENNYLLSTPDSVLGCISQVIDLKIDGIMGSYFPEILKLEEISEQEVSTRKEQVRKYLKQSLLFLSGSRIGILPEQELSSPEEVFPGVESFLMFLGMEQGLSEEFLREFGAIIKAATKTITIEQEKIERSDYYGQNQLPKSRELFDTGFIGRGERAHREIRTDATYVPERAETGSVHAIFDEGPVERALISGGPRSQTDDGEIDGAVISEAASAIQSGHVGMDGTYEQPEKSSGRDDVSGSSLPVAPSKEGVLPTLASEKILFLLQKEDYLPMKHEQIEEGLLREGTTLDEKVSFLKNLYDDSYNSFFYPDVDSKEYVGYKKEENGLFLWEGNYLTRSAECFLSWVQVVQQKSRLLSQEYNIEGFSQVAMPIEVLEPDYFFDSKGKVQVRKEILQNELRLGSGFANGKFRIYEYFQEEHSKQECVAFLKKEYGLGGHSFSDADYSMVDSDSSGLHFKAFSHSNLDVVYSWGQVSDLLAEEIRKDMYLTESEKEELSVYENEMEARGLADKLKVFFENYYKEEYSEQMPVFFGAIPFRPSSNFEKQDFYALLVHPIGKDFLVTALEPFKLDLSDLFDQVATFDSKQSFVLPGWSRLDWELRNSVKQSTAFVTDFKENMVVYLSGKEFSVFEISGDQIVLQDPLFPLFTQTYERDALISLLRADVRNQEYFAPETEKPKHDDLSARNYRLFTYFAPEILSGEAKYLRFENGKGYGCSIQKGVDDQIFLSILDIHEGRVLLSLPCQLIPEEERCIPLLSDSTISQDFVSTFLYGVFQDFQFKECTLVSLDHPLLFESEITPSKTVEAQVLEEERELEELSEEPELSEVSHEKLSMVEDEATIPAVTEGVLSNLEPVSYHIKPDSFQFGGPKERFRDNLTAIRVLKQIEGDARFATAEEQEILFRYVGWGGLSQAFDEKNMSWKQEYEELLDVLTEEEYLLARESTLTAFYTPPVVSSSMYELLSRLGFQNGNILDPACGTGNFYGMLPEAMDGSHLYGVELDSISGRIAKQLYQKASIAIEGFEKTKLPDQFFDVAIGNVPFGQFSVIDDVYKNENFMIHDYFFAKALDKIRPGGIVLFMTSKGTMDKQNSQVREYLAKRADLLGAIRLPNDTFTQNAGTTVTSDILVLQKRDRMRLDIPEWVFVGENEEGFTLNSYFIDHPEMVLGDLKMVKGQAGREDLACVSNENGTLKEKLFEAITHIQGKYEAYDFDMEDLGEDQKERSVPADFSIQNFGYTLVEDEVFQRRDSRMYPVETNAKALGRIRGMISLRDTMRSLIQLQLESGSDRAVEALQLTLTEQYDSFVKEFGRINSMGNSRAFSDDSSYYLLCSLEMTDEEDMFLRKADIFSKRTIRSITKPTKATDSMDAFALSMGEKGCVDLSYMSMLLGGKKKEEIVLELTGVIYKDPEFMDEEDLFAGYLPAEEYLSGDVKHKLVQAKYAANEDPTFQVNVESLLQVQPKDLDATEISIRLGATWIPEDIVTEFSQELFQIPERDRDPEYWGYVHAIYSSIGDSWTLENKDRLNYTVAAKSTYGTSRRSGPQIFEDILNLKQSQVIDYYEESGKKKSQVNQQETIAAMEKQDVIKEAFSEWIFADPERRNRLVRLYNDRFNTIRPREYNGDYIRFSGINPEITLFKHQKDAIARVLYGGNTLLAHVVGAGKTWEMTAAAMESKRLGLCHKSLFVVPNHLLKQWASDFLELYPAANILVATEKDFTPQNRKKFCARIATGDFDAVIIGHSQFERIPLSIERQKATIEEEISQISFEIARFQEEHGNRMSVKQLERMKKSLENNLAKLNDQEKKDDVITFEELGVDRLFVDEFHFYKNLFLYTKMQNIAGIQTTNAQKTTDLYMKCKYLDELTGYRGVIGATGTPITNSMSELYTLQRYFASNKLDAMGLSSFDAWASTFGEVVTSVELAPEGTNYRAKQRFSKFYNLPELINLYHDFADVKTADMLELDVPEVSFHNVDLEPSDAQRELLVSLVDRADAVRTGQVDRTEDNMLKITNDGRKLALDQRLLDSDVEDNVNSKAEVCAENVVRIYRDTDKDKLTQLVFCDLSTPGTSKEEILMEEKDGVYQPAEKDFSNVYEDLRKKLVAKGIPDSEIAFIHEANTTKRKESLFANVRSGKVRVLLGSRFKMGAGTNVQNRLFAIHDLDCPWRPADLEQGLGRMVRQGNMNKNVEVYRYVTQDTFDAYSYQLLENKQKFISQIQTSKSPVRVAEDIGDEELKYAELKALATGNPLIKEKMDLDLQVARLNTLKANYLKTKFQMEDSILNCLPTDIARCHLTISALHKDLAAYEAVKDLPFAITIGNRVYTDVKEASKAFMESLALHKKTKNSDFSIGEFHGFSLSGKRMFNFFEIYLQGAHSYSFDAYKRGERNIEKLQECFLSISEKLEKMEEKLSRSEVELEKSKVEVLKPFSYEDELKEKKQRLSELNILLSVEGGSGKEDLLGDAKSPETSPELLHRMADNEDSCVRAAVAGNENTMLADLLVLKDDPDKEVQKAVLCNPHLPVSELEVYCKNASDDIKESILESPNVTGAVIEILVNYAEKGSNFLYKAAKHKAATPEILDVLAHKGSQYLAQEILQHPKVCKETVLYLGNKYMDDWYTMSKVVAHPYCSEELICKALEQSNCCLYIDEILNCPNITNSILEKVVEIGGYTTSREAERMLKERKTKEIEPSKSLDSLIEHGTKQIQSIKRSKTIESRTL